MFESGYLIPSFFEHILPPGGLLAGLVNRVVDKYVPSSELSRVSPKTSTHLAGIFATNTLSIILLSLVLILLLLFLFQLYLGLSGCMHRKRPKTQRSTYFLRTFILIWLITSAALLSSVIFCSEHLDLFESKMINVYSVLDHMDSVVNRSMTVLHSVAEDALSPVNDFTNGVTTDLYETVLSEVPTITNHFLQLTDLDAPLAMLGDLAQVVDDLLNAHIFLRENGPQVALEFDKLDSNIKLNIQALAVEVA